MYLSVGLIKRTNPNLRSKLNLRRHYYDQIAIQRVVAENLTLIGYRYYSGLLYLMLEFTPPRW